MNTTRARRRYSARRLDRQFLTTVRIPVDERDRLFEAARRLGLSQSAFVRAAVIERVANVLATGKLV